MSEMKTTDGAALSVTEEAHIEKTDTLPKSWTDDDRAKYVIVRNYLETIDAEEAVFDGVPDKVVKRARRDAQ